MGENVGAEINGKGEFFTRPVYVLRSLGYESAIVAPLTSQPKSGTWYHKIKLNGKKSHLAFSQVRAISVSRIGTKIGYVSDAVHASVLAAFKEFMDE